MTKTGLLISLVFVIIVGSYMGYAYKPGSNQAQYASTFEPSPANPDWHDVLPPASIPTFVYRVTAQIAQVGQGAYTDGLIALTSQDHTKVFKYLKFLDMLSASGGAASVPPFEIEWVAVSDSMPLVVPQGQIVSVFLRSSGAIGAVYTETTYK